MPEVVSHVIGVGVVSVVSKSAIVMIAHKQGAPAKIIDRIMNGSGVRDTSWVLGVSVTTVIAHLKKLKPVNVNPQPIQAVLAHTEIELVCEVDE